MRRSAKLERMDQMTELLFHLIIFHTKTTKHALLQLCIMDTDRTTAHLETVHDDVVAIARAGKRIGLDLVPILFRNHRERMMFGGVLLLVRVIAEHGEVDDPEKSMTVALDTESIGHMQAQRGEHGACRIEGVGREEKQVARLDTCGFLNRIVRFLAEELDDGALAHKVGISISVGDPRHALCAICGSNIGKLLNLAARPIASRLRVDALHNTAVSSSAREHLEIAVLDKVGQIDELHAEADIGAVATEALHRLFPRHALKRELVLNACSAEDFLENAFHQIHHVGLFNKRHLDVDLGELGLTISAQVLIAEATGNLVIALDAADHEHLLELLRRLRQSIELARVRTGRHEVIARAFRSRVCKNRSFNLDETALVESLTHCLGNLVAKQKVRVHLRATKVEITPLHTGGFVRLDAVLDGEMRCDRSVEDFDGSRENLDFTGDHVGVLGTLATRTNATGNLQNILAAKMLGDMELLFADAIGVDNDLRIPLAIAKVAEDQSTMVAIVPSPAGKHNLTPNIALAQLTAGRGMHAKLVLEVRH